MILYLRKYLFLIYYLRVFTISKNYFSVPKIKEKLKIILLGFDYL